MELKITLDKTKNLWFTSDTHYNHVNICSGVSEWTDKSRCRDFNSIESMNSTIVNNINEKVKQDDILFHLGDWSFGGFGSIKEFRDKLVCKNIHIVTGNHDHHIEKNREGCQNLFSSVNKYLKLIVNYPTHEGMRRAKFILFHFPIASHEKISYGFIHLHGHVHFSNTDVIGKGKMMDVGVDGNIYYPRSFKSILRIMENQPIKSMFSFNHHTL